MAAWHWQTPPPPVNIHQVEFCHAYFDPCQFQEQSLSRLAQICVFSVNWPSLPLHTKTLHSPQFRQGRHFAPKDLHKVITFRGKEPMMGKRLLLKWTMSRKGPSYLPYYRLFSECVCAFSILVCHFRRRHQFEHSQSGLY